MLLSGILRVSQATPDLKRFHLCPPPLSWNTECSINVPYKDVFSSPALPTLD